MTGQLSRAQTEALNVLAVADARHKWVGVHNHTSPPGQSFSTIHWHSARHLIGLGYAAMDGPCIVLTGLGRTQWKQGA